MLQGSSDVVVVSLVVVVLIVVVVVVLFVVVLVKVGWPTGKSRTWVALRDGVDKTMLQF